MKMINNNFIQSLLAQKTDVPLSRFRELDMHAILSTICAFLNGDGGWIVVGVDNNNNVVDVPNLNAAYVSTEVTKNISPMPLVYVQQELWQERLILLITVIKGQRAPYSINGRYYIIDHNGAAVVPNKDEISMLMRKKKVASSWEAIPTSGADEDDIDFNRVDRVYQIGMQSSLIKPRIQNGHDLLAGCGLLDYGVVKNGAMALFGTEPSRFMRQCRCRIQVMFNGKTANQYEDVRILECNVFEMIEKLRNYFYQTLPNVGTFSDSKWERRHDTIYPMEVLDEAIVNALVHRDMGDLSGEVLINIYRDKMEITNSGEIPDGILKNKNKILPHISELRNPLMAEVLYIAGLMEKTGRGMALIYNRMTAEGLSAPEWQSRNGYTTLTIYSTPAALPKIPQRAVEFLRKFKGGFFSKVQYYEFFGGEISQETAKKDISALVRNGMVVVEGAGPSTIYKQTGKSLPDFTR